MKRCVILDPMSFFAYSAEHHVFSWKFCTDDTAYEPFDQGRIV